MKMDRLGNFVLNLANLLLWYLVPIVIGLITPLKGYEFGMFLLAIGRILFTLTIFIIGLAVFYKPKSTKNIITLLVINLILQVLFTLPYIGN